MWNGPTSAPLIAVGEQKSRHNSINLEEHDWEVVDMPGGLSYAVPDISDSGDGWGPSDVPAHLKDIPFAPFSKQDKLGKAADWTNQNYQKYSGV